MTKQIEIMWTKQQIEEQNNFDYEALFNSEVEELAIEEVEAKVVYQSVKVIPSTQDVKHHLARLAMMMSEERGQELSYKQALKQ